MKRAVTMITIVGSLFRAAAQDTLSLTLSETIELGTGNSVDAVMAESEYISAYWEYRTHLTELLPEVSLAATLPAYSKSYNAIQTPTGEYRYVSNHYNRMDAKLSVSQNIPWTGGTVAVESSLERLQQNGGSSYTSYGAIPGLISLRQPIFGFNSVRWNQRIEPVKFREARKRLVSAREEIAGYAVAHYFSLLLARVNLDIARQNLANAQKLYAVSEARFRLEQVSAIDLQQMNVSLLMAEASLTAAQSTLEERMMQLRSFLGLGEDVVPVPVVPEFVAGDIPALSYPEVLERARANNAFTENIRRRMLEASRAVGQAKAARREIMLTASYGVSGQEDRLRSVVNSGNWRDDQMLNIGLSIPILDWGKRRGRVRVAEANQRLAQAEADKDVMDFNQNVLMAVQYFNAQPRQLSLARETDALAQQRYETSVDAFILGSIAILDLNDARASKDEARRNYIEQLRNLWAYYYDIRALTLYDFITGEELAVDYPE